MDVRLAAIVAPIASAATKAAIPIGNSGTTVRLDWTDSSLALMLSSLTVNEPCEPNRTPAEIPGIKIEGQNKMMTVIQNAALERKLAN